MSSRIVARKAGVVEFFLLLLSFSGTLRSVAFAHPCSSFLFPIPSSVFRHRIDWMRVESTIEGLQVGVSFNLLRVLYLIL